MAPRNTYIIYSGQQSKPKNVPVPPNRSLAGCWVRQEVVGR